MEFWQSLVTLLGLSRKCWTFQALTLTCVAWKRAVLVVVAEIFWFYLFVSLQHGDLRAIKHEIHYFQGLSLVFLTFLWHFSPFWVGEFVLAHPDPPLHSRRNGLARVGVKWGEAAQTAEKDSKITAICWDGIKKGMHHLKMFVVHRMKHSQDVRDDAQRPHVTWLVVFLWTQNLRSLMQNRIRSNSGIKMLTLVLFFSLKPKSNLPT